MIWRIYTNFHILITIHEHSLIHRLVHGHVSHWIAFIVKDIPTSERDTPCLIGRFVHLVLSSPGIE